MNLLFVCSQNFARSPTAATLFATYPGVRTRSAGTDPSAVHPLDAADIAWADLIFVMESVHAHAVRSRFKELLTGKRRYNLGIPDDYSRDDPVLIQLLRRRVEPILDLVAKNTHNDAPEA